MHESNSDDAAASGDVQMLDDPPGAAITHFAHANSTIFNTVSSPHSMSGEALGREDILDAVRRDDYALLR